MGSSQSTAACSGADATECTHYFLLLVIGALGSLGSLIGTIILLKKRCQNRGVVEEATENTNNAFVLNNDMEGIELFQQPSLVQYRLTPFEELQYHEKHTLGSNECKTAAVKPKRSMLFFHCPAGLRSLNRRSNSFLNSPNSTYTLLTRHTNECETEDEEDGDHVCFERFDQLDPISEDLQSISTYQEIIDSVHSTSNTTQNLRSPLQACSVNEYETVTVRKRRQDFIAEDTELSKIKNLFSFEGTEDMRSPNSLWKDRLDGTNIIHTAISLKEGGRASGTSSSFIPHQAEDSERRFQSRNFATKSDTVLEKENKQPQNVFGQCQKPSVTRNERNEELITSRKATIHRPMVNRQVKVVSHHLENQHSPNNHNRKSLRCENDGRVPRTPSSPQCSSETVLSTDSTGRFAFSTTPMEMDWNTE
ncbi:hypothetical protein CSKR_112738 [Clonorchis sinensis]|uniref:Uncharacterized protein n=1 Tax=Clonorchis sinensis TaxID=79923 RepID=A0A8T1LZI4_CLOSI|nr:hypothetical protein CSKR_112738 [Clonorchis sinensis]